MSGVQKKRSFKRRKDKALNSQSIESAQPSQPQPQPQPQPQLTENEFVSQTQPPPQQLTTRQHDILLLKSTIKDNQQLVDSLNLLTDGLIERLKKLEKQELNRNLNN